MVTLSAPKLSEALTILGRVVSAAPPALKRIRLSAVDGEESDMLKLQARDSTTCLEITIPSVGRLATPIVLPFEPMGRLPRCRGWHELWQLQDAEDGHLTIWGERFSVDMLPMREEELPLFGEIAPDCTSLMLRQDEAASIC